jgi:N-acetyldiaminopimelate deacetylase
MLNLQDLYDLRKKLHRTPETAFNEFKTQEIIQTQLSKYSELKLTKFEPTGLLYEYSHGTGEYLLFRADMDALPIQENTHCDFQSQNLGVSHACGHDMHMTILIGLIQYVIENKLKKNLLFLFQPAEEGYGGATHIINTGVFNKYNIKHAFALHVSAQFPTGTIGIKSGIILGIPQEFDVEFFGKSGHVATPHKGKDAFLAAMAFYQEVRNLINKKFPIQDPIIFHIGKATAGNVRNIISEYCKLEGTFRCLKKDIKEKVLDLMNSVAKSIENSHELDTKITLLCTYDPVINDEKLTQTFLKKLPKDIKVVNVDYSMTGEDFGFFTSLYPSLLFWLGTNSPEDLHSDKFLADEKSIDVALNIYKSLL